MDNFHSKSINQALIDTNSSKDGLSSVQASERKVVNNQDEHIKRNSIAFKFMEQFADLMIIILLIAAAVSIAIGIINRTAGEIADGCIILAIVIMNAVFGVVQEHKAEKSLEALKKLSQQEILVQRNGEKLKISTDELVVGDVIILEAGVILPADVRLIETHSLQIDEASLTGESNAVEKDSRVVCNDDAPLGERKNMAYKGTVVSFGRGRGLVVALGDETELGKIAKVIKENEKQLTPLQKSIKDVGKMLTYLVLGIAVVTFIIQLCISPTGVLDAFLTAVAIAVAAIPESMPAVITIIMSLGVARLAKQKAIVKRMHSVETLGCCDVICSDKTGTITQNKMTVVCGYSDGQLQEKKFLKTDTNMLLMRSALLCNDTTIAEEKVVGDPTEVALTELGQKYKIFKHQIDDEEKRINEIPFDSKRKLMSVLTQNQNQECIMWTKGAIDSILDRCDSIVIENKIVPLTKEKKEQILTANNEMSDKALRVLAFAYKDIKSEEEFKEEKLIFIGLLGMIDPPREEIKSAVKKCRRAGMRPVMITGDYSQTAFAIAREVGIAKDISEVITGVELSKLSDDDLFENIEKYSVYARVSPEDKVRIVQTLKKKGHVVSMTGDGVNDAPSLKKADIGIGMGITGTDVAKEVADMIIADDNFATIVVAVEEGRKIYRNIQKTVKFLFSANLAELLSLFIGTIFFPSYVYLFPVQILFVNLITDSLPAIALGVENPDSDLMKVPPRNAKKGLFSNGIGVSIIILGLFQTAYVVTAYVLGMMLFSPQVATTLAFYTLNIIQMFYLASMRTDVNIFLSKPHKNKFFLLSLLLCFGLTALFAFTPLRTVLRLEALSLLQWGIVFGLSLVMLITSEIYKVIEKAIRKKKNQA